MTNAWYLEIHEMGIKGWYLEIHGMGTGAHLTLRCVGREISSQTRKPGVCDSVTGLQFKSAGHRSLSALRTIYMKTYFPSV